MSDAPPDTHDDVPQGLRGLLDSLFGNAGTPPGIAQEGEIPAALPAVSGARGDAGELFCLLPGFQTLEKLPKSHPLYQMAATRTRETGGKFIILPPDAKAGDHTGALLVQIVGARLGQAGGVVAMVGEERVEAVVEDGPDGLRATHTSQPDIENPALSSVIADARQMVERSALPNQRKAQITSAGDEEFPEALLSFVLGTPGIDDAVAVQIRSNDPAERLTVLLPGFAARVAKIVADNPELALIANLKQKDLPEGVRKRVDREVSRFEQMDPRDPSRGDVEPWLKLVADLPWGEHPSPVTRTLREIRASLDENHAGLDEVKDTLIQQVDQYRRGHGALNPDGESAKERAKTYGILLVGPPGTGKTTIVESFAKAIGKGVIKANVGGVYSSGELNGSDRVFRGAHAGQIIQQLADQGIDNVLLLDEIDKITSGGMNGDPYAVLLEILDPSRNEQFQDRWLDLPFDISEIPVVVTANDLSLIPDRVRDALLDRLEVVYLDGYTIPEKIDIAHSHTLGRAYKRSVTTPDRVQITDEAIAHVVRDHTSAAGMRQLERKLAKILNAEETRVSVAEEEGQPIPTFPVRVDPDEVDKILGPGNVKNDFPIEWTEPGRGIWMYVQGGGMGGVGAGDINTLPGTKGRLELTGSVAAGIQESAKAGYGWVAEHMGELGIDATAFEHDLQINYGDIGMPKDGPSAGAMTTVLIASKLMRVPVRSKFTMTGTIEPGGRVGKIGGTVAKILGAYEAGVRTVVIPKANESDLRKLPENVRAELEIILVSRLEEALKVAFPGRFDTARTGLSVIDGGQAEGRRSEAAGPQAAAGALTLF